MKRGDYFKLVGGYEGVVWTGKRWERFDCQRCVILKGIAAGAPLQGPMSKKAGEAMMGPVYHRHDVPLHAAWIKERAAANAKPADPVNRSELQSTGDDELYTEWFKCSNCGDDQITWTFNFCPMCGVRIIHDGAKTDPENSPK